MVKSLIFSTTTSWSLWTMGWSFKNSYYRRVCRFLFLSKVLGEWGHLRPRSCCYMFVYLIPIFTKKLYCVNKLISFCLRPWTFFCFSFFSFSVHLQCTSCLRFHDFWSPIPGLSFITWHNTRTFSFINRIIRLVIFTVWPFRAHFRISYPLSWWFGVLTNTSSRFDIWLDTLTLFIHWFLTIWSLIMPILSW